MNYKVVLAVISAVFFSIFMPISNASAQCQTYIPGPGGTLVCIPSAPAAPAPTATPAPVVQPVVTQSTQTGTTGGLGTVVAAPGDGAYSLAVKCGTSLDVFKNANGMTGPNPLIYVGNSYNCGGNVATGFNANNPAPVPGRSIPDGHQFTITNEVNWAQAAYKCANARTGALEMSAPAVNPGVVIAPGVRVTCPLYNDSNDGVVYGGGATTNTTIPTGSKFGWWASTQYGQQYLEVTTLVPIVAGTGVLYTTAYSANAVATVTAGGAAAGYLIPAAAGTGIIIWAVANARLAVDSGQAVAIANENAQAPNVPASGNTGSPMPPNCEGAWQTLYYSFEGVTNTSAVIARADLTGGAASTFTAALSLLQSSLCADDFNISSDATHWYLSKK